jgi:alginate O-acetyltransferase complex protein AlgI
MLLNSMSYIGFLIVSVFAYWLMPKRLRVMTLLFCGIAYYAYAGVLYLVLILTLSLIAYAGATRRNFFLFTIILLILTLMYFKYISGILPLGISFYMFELIHYLVEARRGTISANNIKTFLTFVFFFPTRMSGPIKRYGEFDEQTRDIRFAPKYLYYGILLIILGFFQKIVIADPLIPITGALNTPDVLSGSFDTFFRLSLYSIRIYADFMGLTNIAMGSAFLFGILVPRNFNYPYLKPNIALFWRNWHMSLSNWTRDYVYIPLGGSRNGESRTFINLFIVMFIIGIWHGSTLNFAAWGIYHGAGLAVHRLWSIYSPSIWKNISGWLRYGLGVFFTFIFVTIGWSFFVTSSLADSLFIIKILFNV